MAKPANDVAFDVAPEEHLWLRCSRTSQHAAASDQRTNEPPLSWSGRSTNL